MPNRTCPECGGDVVGVSCKVYCSPKCRYRARDRRPEVRARNNEGHNKRYAKLKAELGEPPRRAYDRERWERQAGRPVIRTVVRDRPDTCSVPGCDRPHQARGFCQWHYRVDAAARGVEWAKLEMGPGHSRRRAKHYGVPYERYRREDVFERDGWVCQICGDPVDGSLEHPDPMSATVDHIVPLALGGADVFANVQLAHFHCNCVKGAREWMPGELELMV